MSPGAKPKGRVLLRWSPSFAYAIGLLTADGCLFQDGRHLDFTSKDKDQVQTFKKCLGLKVKIGRKQRGGRGTEKRYYRVQFGDVLFYRFLVDIGLSPAKSKTIRSVQVPDQYFADFLRGYFDGDGTSSSFYDSVYPKSYRFYVAFVCASPVFIHWLRAKIEETVGVRGHVIDYPDLRCLQLKYAKHEAIKICHYMYQGRPKVFLRRKYLKVQNSLSIINQRRGGEMATTLRSGRSARKGLRVQVPPSAPK